MRAWRLRGGANVRGPIPPTGLTLVLIGWVLATVPDFLGQMEGRRHRLGAVLAMPGVWPVLFVTVTFVLAHNILYTYVAPFLAAAGMPERTDLVLLVFGATLIRSDSGSRGVVSPRAPLWFSWRCPRRTPASWRKFSALEPDRKRVTASPMTFDGGGELRDVAPIETPT